MRDGLVRNGLNLFPKSTHNRTILLRYKRHEKQVLVQRIQLDVKFLKFMARENKMIHVSIKFLTPHLIGKIERSHNTDKTKFNPILKY